MALASASPRASAQILHFPGAVTAPVVNPPKRRLHYDTTLRPIKLGLTIRMWRLKAEREAAQQVAVPACSGVDEAFRLLAEAARLLQGGAHV